MSIRAEIMDAEYFAKQYCFAVPCVPLQLYVECYWQLDLRNGAPENDYWEQIFANLNASLVFNLGSPFGIKKQESTDEWSFAKSIVVGQRNQPVMYHHANGNFLLGIKFKPAGLSALLDVDAQALNNDFVLINELAKTAELEEKLAADTTFEQRAKRVELFLLGLWAKNEQKNYRHYYLHKAINHFHQNQTGYTINQLAGALSLTPKTLTRYFKHSVGLSPKTSARIVRFRNALPYYVAYGSAYPYDELGYTDFSHFIKDYKAFTLKEK